MSDVLALRGAPIAETVRAGIADDVGRLKASGLEPRMAVVVASDDPATISYAEAKGRTAAKLGVTLDVVTADLARGQDALESTIAELSVDANVHGILLDLPVADGLQAEPAIDRIDPLKDVDGLTSVNLGLIALGREGAAIAPATPAACIRLAEETGPLTGRRVTVVGRGRSVGRALAPMLVNRDATVTVCHSKTPDLAAAIAPADIVFVAAGRPGLIGETHIRPGQVVIDAGINMVDGRLVGDVAPEVAQVASAITPVPGGVGPLTSSLIFANLVRAIALQRQGS